MVHGDDADKAPAAEQPVCGFRVLLSTLKNVEGDTARWYKMAAVRNQKEQGGNSPLLISHCYCIRYGIRCASLSTHSAPLALAFQPEDLMQAGAVECGQKDETTHGMMLFAAKQTWNKKSMRSRLFAVLNG